MLRVITNVEAFADSWLKTYWDTSPITINEVRKMMETIRMILQLNLLEKDLLFT